MTVKLTTTISADYSNELLSLALNFNWQEPRSTDAFVSNELTLMNVGFLFSWHTRRLRVNACFSAIAADNSTS